MGTGKTLQTISFIAFLHENIHHPDRPETDKPTLIILPKAVLRNWDAEFKR
jgi:ATP-dependent DNA helicase